MLPALSYTYLCLAILTYTWHISSWDLPRTVYGTLHEVPTPPSCTLYRHRHHSTMASSPSKQQLLLEDGAAVHRRYKSSPVRVCFSFCLVLIIMFTCFFALVAIADLYGMYAPRDQRNGESSESRFGGLWQWLSGSVCVCVCVCVCYLESTDIYIYSIITITITITDYTSP